MIFTFFAIVVIVRLMVGMVFDVLFYHYRLNHIPVPEPGWRLQIIKTLITITVAGPIFTFMATPR